MNKVSHDQIVGIDVSRDWLDMYCLPDGYRLRLPNTADGHGQVAALARERDALVCFECTGGQEWRLAAHHNPVLKPFADRLRNAGKSHKVIITAVARKLVTIANALCKSRKSWDPQPA